MKYVWAKICDIFARLKLHNHISSTLMLVGRKIAGGRSNSWKTLWERNFWPALGNHVPGTWHQTKLLPNISWSTRVPIFFFENPTNIFLTGKFIVQNLWLHHMVSDKINAKFFVDYKRRKIFPFELIQIGKEAQIICVLLHPNCKRKLANANKSAAVWFLKWIKILEEMQWGKIQPSKEI